MLLPNTNRPRLRTKKVTSAVSGLGVTRLNCNPFHYRTLSETKDSFSESEGFQRLNFFRVSIRESEDWTASEEFRVWFSFRGKHYLETKWMFKFFFIKLNLSSVRGLVKISAHWWSVSMNCEGEKNHKKGGLNCVFGNFFFYVLDNCPQVQSLK